MLKCGEPRRIRDRGRIRTTETSTFQPRSELSPSQIYLPPSSSFIRDRSRGRSTTLDRRVRGHFSIRRNFYLFLLFSFTLPSSMILSFSFFFLFFLRSARGPFPPTPQILVVLRTLTPSPPISILPAPFCEKAPRPDHPLILPS